MRVTLIAGIIWVCGVAFDYPIPLALPKIAPTSGEKSLSSYSPRSTILACSGISFEFCENPNGAFVLIPTSNCENPISDPEIIANRVRLLRKGMIAGQVSEILSLDPKTFQSSFRSMWCSQEVYDLGRFRLQLGFRDLDSDTPRLSSVELLPPNPKLPFLTSQLTSIGD